MCIRDRYIIFLTTVVRYTICTEFTQTIITFLQSSRFITFHTRITKCSIHLFLFLSRKRLTASLLLFLRQHSQNCLGRVLCPLLSIGIPHVLHGFRLYIIFTVFPYRWHEFAKGIYFKFKKIRFLWKCSSNQVFLV